MLCPSAKTRHKSVPTASTQKRSRAPPSQRRAGENQQTWVYHIIPSAAYSSFKPVEDPTNRLKPVFHQLPDQLRRDPFDLNPTASWLDKLHLVAGAGDLAMKFGVG